VTRLQSQHRYNGTVSFATLAWRDVWNDTCATDGFNCFAFDSGERVTKETKERNRRRRTTTAGDEFVILRADPRSKMSYGRLRYAVYVSIFFFFIVRFLCFTLVVLYFHFVPDANKRISHNGSKHVYLYIYMYIFLTLFNSTYSVPSCLKYWLSSWNPRFSAKSAS